MHQQNKSTGLRIYSSSPDSKCSSSCQIRKNPQNNDILVFPKLLFLLFSF